MAEAQGVNRSSIVNNSFVLWNRRNDDWWAAVPTKWGFVAVKIGHSWTLHRSGTTGLQFIWREREYYRLLPRKYTRRHTITLARRFAREIVEGHPQ